MQALKTKGIALSLNQLIAFNNSFDKVRWSIDLKVQKIKATHGHSIAIQQELSPQVPVATLYHGTAAKNITSIIENGLLKRHRQYVHLSETIEMALEVGKRHGIPCIIKIDTEQLLADGREFFKTEQDVWLTSDIPAKYLKFDPWSFQIDKKVEDRLKSELKKEMHHSHRLNGTIDRLKLIALHTTNDDCLFMDTLHKVYYTVHLTQSGKKEHGKWPLTTIFESFNEWVEERFVPDQRDWY